MECSSSTDKDTVPQPRLALYIKGPGLPNVSSISPSYNAHYAHTDLSRITTELLVGVGMAQRLCNGLPCNDLRFDSRWGRCKNQTYGGMVSKWHGCRWDVKHNQPTNITLGNNGLFTDGWCNNFTLNSTTFLNYFSSLRTGDMSRSYEKGLSCKRHLVGENEQELCYLSQEEITRWQHWYIAPCP